MNAKINDKGNGKDNGYTPFTEMQGRTSQVSKSQEGYVIRESIVRIASTNPEADKEIQRYWHAGGSITGVAGFDKHRALMALIDADELGVLDKIAESVGGEGRIFAQMAKVYRKAGFLIKGNVLSVPKLEDKSKS